MVRRKRHVRRWAKPRIRNVSTYIFIILVLSYLSESLTFVAASVVAEVQFVQLAVFNAICRSDFHFFLVGGLHLSL